MSGYSRSQLASYSLRLLDVTEAGEVERHVAACAGCRDILDEVDSTRALLSLLTPADVLGT